VSKSPDYIVSEVRAGDLKLRNGSFQSHLRYTILSKYQDSGAKEYDRSSGCSLLSFWEGLVQNDKKKDIYSFERKFQHPVLQWFNSI